MWPFLVERGSSEPDMCCSRAVGTSAIFPQGAQARAIAVSLAGMFAAAGVSLEHSGRSACACPQSCGRRAGSVLPNLRGVVVFRSHVHSTRAPHQGVLASRWRRSRASAVECDPGGAGEIFHRAGLYRFCEDAGESAFAPVASAQRRAGHCGSSEALCCRFRSAAHAGHWLLGSATTSRNDGHGGRVSESAPQTSS